jgi:serine/threonine-protein kinase
MTEPHSTEPKHSVGERAPAGPPGGTAGAQPPAVGDVLVDKYRLDGLIDEGGMGLVFAATHLQLLDRVAIKIMRPELAHARGFVARFLRESRTASRIRSAHAARVFDVGTLPNGLPFMVMELLDGEALSDRLAREGPTSVTLAIELVLQACEALAHAHGLGLVHRDLKPDNLFLTTDVEDTPCVKVLDFGISKTLARAGSDEDPGITTTFEVLGSPRYMSPEQMRSSKDVDVRTDVWSLGAVLYELLAGKAPFEAASMLELSAKVLRDEPPPLSAARPDVPDGVSDVVRTCLEKAKERRFSDVAALAYALGQQSHDGHVARAARIERILAKAPKAAAISTPKVSTAEMLAQAPKAAPKALSAETLPSRMPLGAAPDANRSRRTPTPTHWEERDVVSAERESVSTGSRRWRLALVAIAALAVARVFLRVPASPLEPSAASTQAINAGTGSPPESIVGGEPRVAPRAKEINPPAPPPAHEPASPLVQESVKGDVGRGLRAPSRPVATRRPVTAAASASATGPRDPVPAAAATERVAPMATPVAPAASASSRPAPATGLFDYRD